MPKFDFFDFTIGCFKSYILEFYDEYKSSTTFFSKFSRVLAAFVFLIVTVPVFIIIMFLFFPIVLVIIVKEKIYAKSKNAVKGNGLKPHKFYNPGYDKLIFSLTGKYLGEETEEFEAIKKKYDEYDFFAFPIIFNFDLQNRILRSTDIRERFEKERIGLFVLEINEYFDDGGETMFEVFPTFSNTNYSFSTNDQEMCGAALSVILDIEIDGFDKLVVWSKGKESEYTVIPLVDLEENFDVNRISDKTKWLFCEKCNNILESLSEYLSLRWEKSTLLENVKLKESADSIRQDLYDRFKRDGRPENVNFCKLVGPRKPHVAFCKVMPEERVLQIKRLTLTKSLEDLQRDFPEYSIETLYQWKLNEIDNCLNRILAITDLDYKSRIFLKSANLIGSIMEDDEADYSAVTIGYSKFFEREINLSLVQLIRKEIGIPMPLCYDRYYEVNQDFMVEVREDYNVNFNMKDYLGGNYLPPGLGQSLNTFKKLGPQMIAYVPNYLKLVQEGKRLNAIRNRSAHTELIGKEDLFNIKEALVSLYVNGILREMLDAKISLKMVQ
jgi:hypothetical protein